MNRYGWISLALAAAPLLGAGPDDEDLGGHVPAIKQEVEEIKKQESALNRILVDSQEAITNGKKPEEVVAELEKQYSAQAKSGASAQERQSYAYTLQILESKRAQEMLERRAQLNVNLDKWKAFAQRATAPGTSDDGVVALRAGAWDGAGAPAASGAPSGTPFFTGKFSGPSAAVQVHRRIESGLQKVRPGVERAQGALGKVEEIQAAAAQIGERRKTLKQEAASIQGERTQLSQQLAAAGPLPGSTAVVQRQMDEIFQANKETNAQDKELVSRMNTLNEGMKARSGQIDEFDRLIAADPKFYENHKSECQFIREYVEGTNRRIQYYYLPQKRLIEANQTDHTTWDQMNAQHEGFTRTLQSQATEWNKQKKTLDAFKLREKIEHLELRHREKLGEIDKLKLELEPLRGKLASILEELRDFSRKMRDWVSDAEAAVRTAREGH